MDRLEQERSIRLGTSRRFVEPVDVWLEHTRVSSEDKLAPADFRRIYRLRVERLDPLVRAYKAATSDDDRLLAAEDLADGIIALKNDNEANGKLPTRIPPVDAVEDFYHIGFKHRDCCRCLGREGIFTLEEGKVCAHCQLEPHEAEA